MESQSRYLRFPLLLALSYLEVCLIPWSRSAWEAFAALPWTTVLQSLVLLVVFPSTRCESRLDHSQLRIMYQTQETTEVSSRYNTEHIFKLFTFVLFWAREPKVLMGVGAGLGQLRRIRSKRTPQRLQRKRSVCSSNRTIQYVQRIRNIPRSTWGQTAEEEAITSFALIDACLPSNSSISGPEIIHSEPTVRKGKQRQRCNMKLLSPIDH